MYGKRKYGRLDREVKPVDPSALPTFVCSHCQKVKHFTAKTVTLTGHQDSNLLFLVARICEDCGKLLQDWVKGK